MEGVEGGHRLLAQQNWLEGPGLVDTKNNLYDRHKLNDDKFRI